MKNLQHSHDSKPNTTENFSSATENFPGACSGLESRFELPVKSVTQEKINSSNNAGFKIKASG